LQVIEKGKWIGIRINGKNIIDEVIFLDENRGTDNEPDWYIELINEKGKYQNWNQPLHGGQLVYVGDKSPPPEQRSLWK
jgi:hypothetical protein